MSLPDAQSFAVDAPNGTFTVCRVDREALSDAVVVAVAVSDYGIDFTDRATANFQSVRKRLKLADYVEQRLSDNTPDWLVTTPCNFDTQADAFRGWEYTPVKSEGFRMPMIAVYEEGGRVVFVNQTFKMAPK